MARATVPISDRLDLNTRTIVGPLDDGIDRYLDRGRGNAPGVLDDVGGGTVRRADADHDDVAEIAFDQPEAAVVSGSRNALGSRTVTTRQGRRLRRGARAAPQPITLLLRDFPYLREDPLRAIQLRRVRQHRWLLERMLQHFVD
jgi:hypothetical protein